MYNGNKIAAIVQARMTSTRLPGKVLFDLAGKPSLQHIIERLRRSKYLDDVIIATTINEADNPIIDLCDKLNCHYWRGSEEDVLQRVLDAAHAYEVDVIVEVTADCAVIDWTHADYLIGLLFETGAEYASNVVVRSFPRGFDTQTFYTKTLERANKEVDNQVDRQHVSTWIYKNPKGKYKIYNWYSEPDLSVIRLTIDTPEDYELVKKVFDGLKEFGIDCPTSNEILGYLTMYPDLLKINSHIQQKDYYKELEACKCGTSS